MASNLQWARWGTRTTAPIYKIVVGKAIVIIIIVVVIDVVSRIATAEYGVDGAVAPLSSLAAVALSLIPLLNVRCLIVAPSHPDRFAAPVPYHHHCPPVCAHPTTFLCPLPPLLIVEFPLAAGDCQQRRRCRHHRRAVALPPPLPLPMLTCCRKCHQDAAAAPPLSSCCQRRSQAADAATIALALLHCCHSIAATATLSAPSCNNRQPQPPPPP